jgi:uncharacterized protein DUF4129
VRTVIGSVLAGGPEIGRRAGQRLARQELAEVSWLQRILDWLRHAGKAVPTGWFGLIVLAVLAILAVAVTLFWVRPARSRRRRDLAVLAGPARTARDYRASAELLAAAGDYTEAIVERVRSIAADLEERAILRPRPGRTADELAAEAAGPLPALAADLTKAARLFDDVRYGGRSGTQAGYAMVTRLDTQIQDAKVAAAQTAQTDQLAPAGYGVPR